MKKHASRRFRRILRFFAAGLLMLIALLLWIWFAPVKTGTMPDQLDLGTLSRDAKVDISFRMLVSEQHPLRPFFFGVRDKLPRSWQPLWQQLSPLIVRPEITDLSTIKPTITGPDFLRIDQVVPRQNSHFHGGHPWIEVQLTVDTSRTGIFSGELHATLDRRSSSVPVRFEVRDRSALPRVLVQSPYLFYSTEHGTNFHAAVKLLSSLPAQIDLPAKLPASLDPYEVVLLSSVDSLFDPQFDAIRSLLARGGRLVICFNDGYRSQLAAGLTKVITRSSDFGVFETDRVDELTSTDIIADPLTENVRLVAFDRASPIVSTGPRAKSLVTAPDGTNSYVAVSRLENGGEIVLVTQPLWWQWAKRFATNSDNSILLRNFLTPPKNTPVR